mmetsp:Transcript_54028/g.112882  ORF Transcript_54028/g.112882 Transcript_54028/m.112882 type:complete len:329 (-) Transcript_54028:489-1475(-)
MGGDRGSSRGARERRLRQIDHARRADRLRSAARAAAAGHGGGADGRGAGVGQRRRAGDGCDVGEEGGERRLAAQLLRHVREPSLPQLGLAGCRVHSLGPEDPGLEGALDLLADHVALLAVALPVFHLVIVERQEPLRLDRRDELCGLVGAFKVLGVDALLEHGPEGVDQGRVLRQVLRTQQFERRRKRQVERLGPVAVEDVGQHPGRLCEEALAGQDLHAHLRPAAGVVEGEGLQLLPPQPELLRGAQPVYHLEMGPARIPPQLQLRQQQRVRLVAALVRGVDVLPELASAVLAGVLEVRVRHLVRPGRPVEAGADGPPNRLLGLPRR